MKMKTKIWLGVGAFALVQTAGVTMEAGRPSLTLTQTVQAAERGVCGWYKNEGRWKYDQCERGERYQGRPSNWNNERGERWNERGERWNERDNRWERGDRGHNGRDWNNGRDRWGERG